MQAYLYPEVPAKRKGARSHPFIVGRGRSSTPVTDLSAVRQRVSSRSMRVIAGTFRSRPLQAPRGTATRPTSDRLRETLFNVLGPRVVGSRFADLYAGSGAVGIEAASRGATAVYFAEAASTALAAVRANLRLLGLSQGMQIEAGGTAVLLRKLQASTERAPGTLPGSTVELLDIVFLDPPYDAAEEYRKTLATLGAGDLLSQGAQVVAEHARRDLLQDRYGALQRTRTLLQGDAALSFYSLTTDEDTLA